MTANDTPSCAPPPLRFTRALAAAVLDRALATADAGQTPCAAACDALAAHFAETPQARRLTVTFTGGVVAVDGTELMQISLHAASLLRRIDARRVHALHFAPNTTAAELVALVGLLGDDTQLDAFVPSVIERALAQNGVRHIGVELADTPRLTARRGDAVADYQDLAAAVQDNHVAAARGRELELAGTEGAVEGAMSWLLERPSELLSLSNYEDVDRFTVGHSVRVALLAMHAARAAGADSTALRTVGTAALLHDVGKSRVPMSILFKQGRLSDEEWQVMTEHTRLGAEILVAQRDVPASAVSVAYCHHMGPQGGGYPQPLLPIRPSSLSRLVRVADVFEALTAIRPYKRELTPLEAFAVMHRHEADFDAHWLGLFVRAIGLFPIGSHVELAGGTLARVLDHGGRPDRPRVRLLTGAHVGRELAVGSALDGQPTDIVRALRRSDVPLIAAGMAPGSRALA